jgi:CHASE2 domain-containing sensor protein
MSLSLCCCKHAVEDQIVLVNIAMDKERFAGELEGINAFDPKVVAIDLQIFADADPYKDTMLVAALRKTGNRVMVRIIDNFGSGGDDAYQGFVESSPVFLAGAKTGFANTIIDENEKRTLSRFATEKCVGGKKEYHFGVRVAMAFDSLRTMKFLDRYCGDPTDVDFKNGSRHFKTFNSEDIFGKKVLREDIEGKIVMFGFMGPGSEDKFYTPLNTHADEPDMYGVEYLANIVAQIMESE